MPKPKLRPFRVRRGARYTCFGDGLCCMDMHGLGPLSRREVRALEVVSPRIVVPADESDFEEPMLRTRGDGGCLFLGAARCDLHASLGAQAKPAGCRRFPLGLTETPTGGRITTSHRCPCRTLGDRPDLSPEAAIPSLLDRRGKPKSDRRIGNAVRLDARVKVSFEEWEAIEADLLERLLALEDPAQVLDYAPFPDIGGDGWKRTAREMVRDSDGDESRFGRALAHFGRSILSLRGARAPAVEPLAWDASFDRAEQRTSAPGDPRMVFADFIADEIWSLEWAEGKGTFLRARADLVTRLAIARHLEEDLRALGRRADRAAAEAVSVVDLVADSGWWTDVREAMPRR